VLSEEIGFNLLIDRQEQQVDIRPAAGADPPANGLAWILLPSKKRLERSEKNSLGHGASLPAVTYPPIMTVGQPATIVPPWAVLSPRRAAGFLQIRTVAEPLMMESGGPTHTHMLPKVAEGIIPIRTVGPPGETIGPPTWGTGTGAGVTIGHTCISVIRAAGGMAWERFATG
jgi:hypothetical protein